MVHRKLVHLNALFVLFTAVPCDLKSKERFVKLLVECWVCDKHSAVYLIRLFHLIWAIQGLLFQFSEEETEAGKVKPPFQSCSLNKWWDVELTKGPPCSCILYFKFSWPQGTSRVVWSTGLAGLSAAQREKGLSESFLSTWASLIVLQRILS